MRVCSIHIPKLFHLSSYNRFSPKSAISGSYVRPEGLVELRSCSIFLLTFFDGCKALKERLKQFKCIGACTNLWTLAFLSAWPLVISLKLLELLCVFPSFVQVFVALWKPFWFYFVKGLQGHLPSESQEKSFSPRDSVHVTQFFIDLVMSNNNI